MTIKEMLTLCGMTQKQFGDLFGIPKRTIENWEYGKSAAPEYVRFLIEYFLKAEEYIK